MDTSVVSSPVLFASGNWLVHRSAPRHGQSGESPTQHLANSKFGPCAARTYDETCQTWASLDCPDAQPTPAVNMPNECDDCVGLDCADGGNGSARDWSSGRTWRPDRQLRTCGPGGCKPDRDGPNDGGGGGDMFDGNGPDGPSPCDCCAPPGGDSPPETESSGVPAVRSILGSDVSSAWTRGIVAGDSPISDLGGGATGVPNGTGEPGSTCPEPECCKDSGDGNGGDGSGGDGGGDGMDCKKFASSVEQLLAWSYAA